MSTTAHNKINVVSHSSGCDLLPRHAIMGYLFVHKIQKKRMWFGEFVSLKISLDTCNM